MRIHLVNPSDISFGTAVITPRWLYVLAAATPREYGDPRVVDETLDPIDFDTIAAGDVVGIGIHTFNALRGYEIGREARKRGATVVFGGIHPDALSRGVARARRRARGRQGRWRCRLGVGPGRLREGTACNRSYDGGRVSGTTFQPARWDLLPADKYMWGSVQTLRGCPKHCSFCSVWRTDGQQPRQRAADAVVREIVELRRMGFRFILLSDDNFYPVTMEDLRLAERQGNTARIESLNEIRRERFELMEMLAKLPDDLVFYTQITMEAAEDPEFLKAMNKAKIRGALVGVESVTPEGLKAIFKDFNYAGDKLVTRLKEFRKHGVHILGSFIFGLPTDKEETFAATAELAQTRRHRVRAVHHADAVSRHRRLREMGREDGVRSDAHRRLSADALLADPARAAAEGLHAASDAVARADSPRHAVGVGSLLQHPRDLGAGEHHQVDARAAAVRDDVEAVPADVCEHGHRHRQRACDAVGELGALDRAHRRAGSSSRRRCRICKYRTRRH